MFISEKHVAKSHHNDTDKNISMDGVGAIDGINHIIGKVFGIVVCIIRKVLAFF